MTVEHYIVFIGAGAALANQLFLLEGRIAKSRVIAPAVGKKQVGVTEAAVELASKKLHDQIAGEDSPSRQARLYLWMYEPTNFDNLALVWKVFGHASWVETIPRSYLHKVTATMGYLEDRTNEIRPLLHEISNSTYAQRKTSPLTLPLRNFSSQITKDLKGYWYNGLDKSQISRRIGTFKARYSQTKHKARGGYKDDKALIFKPAIDTECHGKPHPIGTECKAFVCGRFRYGVSLFCGFHFDVSAESSPTIQCNLRTSSGNTRSIRSEKRTYVNIFPNDYILPKK